MEKLDVVFPIRVSSCTDKEIKKVAKKCYMRPSQWARAVILKAIRRGK